MNYIKITRPDIENGRGIRATLWVAGCTRACRGCHNPSTHAFNVGTHVDDEHAFTTMLIDACAPTYMRGLTLSGGDPLCQSNDDIDMLCRVIERFKLHYGSSRDIWLFTGARIDDERECANPHKRRLLSLCDVVVDGRFEIEHRDTTRAFRGSTNQRIMRNVGNATFVDVTQSYDND